ncbi:MAG: methylenetetrahydrofolate--tRNA-(uracil(54)-C(5))-methyltransferase (FADH(2)-oxidizing) TrmFO [Deltaproteobacteria bacterium CG11_big_fil_rev_8_21_14_0_20_45_16]|nr:MAG: methylenetetrahydrofolate--tRNA-(uracil(54)-C(5))-methyltransferase (FADH(2)-oxidizing) TrmFO [Deltaproteobacteria bacterium CG11_big_fil_rev_8_21_14_0_20_45_16]
MTPTNKKNFDFRVIGAGLAGSEAALVLSRAGFRVELIEQKPQKFSAAHRLPGAAELVCSNSLKSLDPHSAHGLLKAELQALGSPLIDCGLSSRVPGGEALSVDREKFSALVSKEILEQPSLDLKSEEVLNLPEDGIPTLIATGPLSGQSLMEDILNRLGSESLYFYDATSPVVSLESLDLDYFFWGARHNPNSSDYLNLPLSKDEYLQFREDLLAAEKTPGHLPDEDLKYFEGCLPIEVLAERGQDTLAFSCMKPIGLKREGQNRAYAVIQFRREKAAGEILNMVGFQTRMKWGDQARVFRKLPGMRNAEFLRLGAMHRNSFINAPRFLSDQLNWKSNAKTFMAGQITGSEGYSEAIATGHYAALCMMELPLLPENTAMRSLVRFIIHSDEENFQPMNFNFGLLPELPEAAKIKGRARLGKAERKALKAERSLRELDQWLKDNWENLSRPSSSDHPWRRNFLKTLTEPDEAISSDWQASI